jgi:hypothetical protein
MVRRVDVGGHERHTEATQHSMQLTHQVMRIAVDSSSELKGKQTMKRHRLWTIAAGLLLCAMFALAGSESSSYNPTDGGMSAGTSQSTVTSTAPHGGASKTSGTNIPTLVTMATSKGWDIFTGDRSNWWEHGYRYGPSIIINSDGSDDMWTCSPGMYDSSAMKAHPWDYIRYRHSTDAGHSWTADHIVEPKPTEGSADANSTCDPGVIHFNGYYYVAYTSTTDEHGRVNNVFVARSTTPEGTFEKWNGTGWGGNPQPIVRFTGSPTAYGAGEPSFVYVGSTLYLYYSWLDSVVQQTRVATVDNPGDNWPAALTYQGVALNRHITSSSTDNDSTDIKYSDDFHEFVGVATDFRFTAQAQVVTYESADGIHFMRSPLLFAQDDSTAYAHNVGMSGDSMGHIHLSDRNFIAFAYGPWANQANPVWNLHLSPITLVNRVENASFEAPNVGNGFLPPGGYRVRPASAVWSFSGTAGISANNSAITSGNPAAPDGSQVAFLQQTGSFEQEIAGLQADVTYRVDFSAAQQGNVADQQEDFLVQIDGRAVGNFKPSGTDFADLQTSAFTVSTGSHTLRFTGIGSVGNDNTALIDQVRIAIVHPPGCPLLAYPHDIVASTGPQAGAVIDGDPATSWSSARHSTDGSPEWLSVDFGSLQSLEAVTLVPRVLSLTIDQNTFRKVVGFPTSFLLQTSDDGTNWSTIPGQSYAGHITPPEDGVTFTFGSEPLTRPIARHFRIYATSLDQDNLSGTSYSFELAELSVHIGCVCIVPKIALTC